MTQGFYNLNYKQKHVVVKLKIFQNFIGKTDVI